MSGSPRGRKSGNERNDRGIRGLNQMGEDTQHGVPLKTEQHEEQSGDVDPAQGKKAARAAKPSLS